MCNLKINSHNFRIQMCNLVAKIGIVRNKPVEKHLFQQEINNKDYMNYRFIIDGLQLRN